MFTSHFLLFLWKPKPRRFFSFTYMLVMDNVYAKVSHKEWRGHPYALDLRGRPRKFGTPLYTYKNATTPQGREHS